MRLAVSALCVIAALVILTPLLRPEAEASPAITAADRARGLTFDAGVAPADRQWISAALVKVRPEAARLIAEVDGLTHVRTFHEPAGWAMGWAEPIGRKRYEVRFNVARLDGERVFDRDVVVIHEFGHVVDYALVPDALRDRLAAAVPRTGACPEGVRADCAQAQERFADTFAKWALRGAVSAVGAGYSLPAPASLEDWGAPLAELAVELEVAAR